MSHFNTAQVNSSVEVGSIEPDHSSGIKTVFQSTALPFNGPVSSAWWQQLKESVTSRVSPEHHVSEVRWTSPRILPAIIPGLTRTLLPRCCAADSSAFCTEDPSAPRAVWHEAACNYLDIVFKLTRRRMKAA